MRCKPTLEPNIITNCFSGFIGLGRKSFEIFPPMSYQFNNKSYTEKKAYILLDGTIEWPDSIRKLILTYIKSNEFHLGDVQQVINQAELLASSSG